MIRKFISLLLCCKLDDTHKENYDWFVHILIYNMGNIMLFLVTDFKIQHWITRS